jgi:TrkA-C domain
MAAIVSVLVIAMLSLLAVRAGSTALMMTGLSWDTASFQSYSAFFGVGFTTREAEMVVNHPVRRRIIRDLILAGNIGITSAAATLVATMVQNSDGFRPLLIIGGLIAGLGLLLFFVRVGWVQRAIDWTIRRTMERAGLTRVIDYELLLRIQHGYVIAEMEVLPDSIYANQTLRQSRPWDQGVVILSVNSNGKDLPGIPNANTTIQVGDVVTVYGDENSLRRAFEAVNSPSG